MLEFFFWEFLEDFFFPLELDFLTELLFLFLEDFFNIFPQTEHSSWLELIKLLHIGQNIWSPHLRFHQKQMPILISKIAKIDFRTSWRWFLMVWWLYKFFVHKYQLKIIYKHFGTLLIAEKSYPSSDAFCNRNRNIRKLPVFRTVVEEPIHQVINFWSVKVSLFGRTPQLIDEPIEDLARTMDAWF